MYASRAAMKYLKEHTGKFKFARYENVVDAKIKVIGTITGLFGSFSQSFAALAQTTGRGLRVAGHAAPFVGQLRGAGGRKEVRVFR